MITIPSLGDVTDILDTDLVMVTNSQGQSYKIAGSELNKRNKIIIASSTTVTGAPLKTGNCVRIYFTANINGVNASTTMQINYNGTNYYVKVPKNGALANYVAFDLGSSTYRYVQAYTTLELLFDGTQFVIIGNPVVISSTDYTIYADGLKRENAVTSNSKNMVTSGAVYTEIFKTKDFWNLRVKAVAPTTQETETVYNSRKISDYYWILFDIGTGAYNTRETLLVPSSKVTQNSNFYMFTTIGGNPAEIDIDILSDTQYKIKSNNNQAFVGIYGFIQK